MKIKNLTGKICLMYRSFNTFRKNLKKKIYKYILKICVIIGKRLILYTLQGEGCRGSAGR